MISQINKFITLTGRFLSRYGWMLAAALLYSTFANAQEKPITLQEAIKLGLENSKTLKLSQSKIDQAVSEYNQAKDRALPTGSASFMYSRAQIPANHLNFGPNGLYLPTSANANLGIANLSETIYAGGKLRYAKESTDLLVQVARLDVDNNKDQIAYGIINEYYNLYKVIQSQKVVEQNITSVDQQIHQAQRFLDQGLVTKNDVLRFQLQRANIELNGIDLESNRKVINYNLNILLGLPESTRLTVASIPVTAVSVAPLQNYIDTAINFRPDVKQYALRTQVAETNIKSVKADRSVRLAGTAGAYYVDIAANPFPTTGNYITPLTIGATLSWNFSTLWTNRNKEVEAGIQRDQTIINKNIALDNVKNEVNTNYQTYLAAVTKINLLQTSIAQATENNKLQESKYENNTGTATDRVDARTLLYQAQINLEIAKADAGLAYYNLIKSTGTLNK